MPPKKKNTKSNQIQPVDQIIQNVVQDFVNKNTSTTSVSASSQEVQTPKKGTRKPRTTKKKDLPSQQESNESNIIDPSDSPVIIAETQQQEEVIPTKKKPGRKPKVKQQQVNEEPQEQPRQQPMSLTVTSQNQLLFINATPAEPVKKKPGRKPKAKKQEEAQQNQQQPSSEEKIVNTQQKSTAIPTSSPAAIRNLINFDEDSYSPYNFNKGKNLSENNSNHNSPPHITPSPVVQPVIAPNTPTSTVTPPVPAPSKRGRPKKVKVDSQNATSTPDVTESHDTKPAPTRKRKSRKQEASTELDKQSEIVASESQQQLTEEVEQPTTPAKVTKKRRTKKQDAANTSALESTPIEQTPIQNDQQPPVKTKRGRPKKIKPNDIVVDKPAVCEETDAINVEKANGTEGSHTVESQLPQQKSSVSEDLQVPSEQQEPKQQEPIDSATPDIGPKNSSGALNENTKMSEISEQEKPAVSVKPQTVNKDEDVKLTDVKMDDAQDKEEEAINSPAGEQSSKKRSLSHSDSDNEDIDHQPTPKKLSRIEEVKARMERFSKLRSRMGEGESANRKEVYEEHQRKRTNPKEMIRQERKREEAEKLLAKQQAEERGEDYERSRFWEYSIESVEKWEKKQEKKAKKSDVAFTDYNQVAHKKYKRQINDFKPDLTTYNEQKAAAMASSSLITTEDGQVVSVDTESNFYRDANSLQYASVDNRPSQESIDKVVADVNKTIAKREKSSRQKTINEEDDITYINERNRRFNEKIGRFYDKYTKEIKENFERGTAL